MDVKEGTATIINQIDSVCEELSAKDKIEVLQNVYHMVDMYLEEAYPSPLNPC